ncbi:phosphoribosyl-ATP diphosphatase [Citromicrobium bathyomarinum]|uniref:phosphoribosyl-ATP diphosphatase n=1 Tax=Citromicrobium bathyomarinum TaxID=72174 RepID=UPI00315A7F98
METLARLEQIILERRSCDPETSYVALLKREGRPTMARKLGEEAVEATVAALSGSDEDMVGESADLLFHLMVLLADRDIALADVMAELDRREGISGIEEKASRPKEGETTNAH